MKVYLKKDVAKLGQAHEVHDVADGFARNYLIPRGFAVLATSVQVNKAQEHEKSQQERLRRTQMQSQQLAERIASKPLKFTVKAGEKGRLYGSITSADVAEAIGEAMESSFDKRAVMLERPIRELGIHSVELKLAGGVQGQVQVVVEAEAE